MTGGIGVIPALVYDQQTNQGFWSGNAPLGMANDPYSGMPGRPSYQQGYDPNTMSVTPEVEARLNKIQADNRGLNAYRQEALRKGSSRWAGLQNQKQYSEETDARERAKREGRSAKSQAESDLAMSGGLTSGARERLSNEGVKNQIAMSQEAGRQGNLNRMQIGINDEQNRISQLGALPGMENQTLQAQLQKEGMWNQAKQTDMQRIIEENRRRNDYNQNVYNQQMQAWGANKQAGAIENSGKK
jgi:hypothetical protein